MVSLRLKQVSPDVTPDPSLAPAPELSPEIFRQLYASLDMPLETDPVIGVTSAIAGEGRTTVALGLARTLANDFDVVVSLVEVDLDQPSLGKRFEMDPTPGMAEVLRGEKRLADVRSLVAPNLCLITAGTVGSDTANLLHQLPFDDPFHGPQALGGVVILDLPPILSHGYSTMAASVADATLLVVRAGVTPSDIVREAVARLDDRPPRGVILNAPRSTRPSWWPGHNK